MIESCIYCQVNTAGQHEWNCPIVDIHPELGQQKPKQFVAGNVLSDAEQIALLFTQNETLRREKRALRKKIDFLLELLQQRELLQQSIQ